VLVTALALTVNAAADPGRMEQRKRDVVRALSERTGRLDNASALLDAAAEATALTAIEFDAGPGSPTVILRTSDTPVYKAFPLEGGAKIVIDFADTVNLHPGQTITPRGPSVVQGIRTSLFAMEPRFVSRVVIDLAKPCPFKVASHENTVTVSLKAKRVLATPPAPAEPQAGPAAGQIAAPPAAADTELNVQKLFVSLAALRARYHPNHDAAPALTARLAAGFDLARQALQGLGSGGSLLLSQSLRGLEQLERDRIRLHARPELAQAGPLPKAPEDANTTSDAAVRDRIKHLAEELEAVHASQFELASLPLTPLAAVTEGPAPAMAAASEEKPASESAGNEAPPPPEKREKAAPSGPPVVTRMKQILSNAAAAMNGGVTTPQVEAAPLPQEKGAKPAKPAKEQAPAEAPPVVGNPMEQMVNIDFREMELTNVVALLAQKAQINVIAGADLTGVVTANLRNVTLRQAIDTVLRMSNLGVLEEAGIYRIVPYEEAVAAKRVTHMVKLDNVKASDMKKTLEDVLKGSPEETLMSISANESTNMLIIAGPEARVMEFECLTKELDIAKPVTPTVTEAIKINNAEPKDLQNLVLAMLSKDIGKVGLDDRSRHLVVTDMPVVIEQVRALIKQVDLPVKQVSVDTMVVDAVLDNNSQTGVDWIFNSVRQQNLRGRTLGSINNLGFETDSTGVDVSPGNLTPVQQVGSLMFGVLTSHVDIKAVISAQVENNKARLLANPVVVTVENKKASVNITQEIPYQEFRQSLTGPPMTSTSFKDVGIVLEVTPRVTHDDHVITEVKAKESSAEKFVNNIPVENKRETQTTLRTRNGQAIFIGGLRSFQDITSGKKVPILGDIPIMNIMFRNNVVNRRTTELLVFLTCNVMPDETENLNPELQGSYEELDSTPKIPNSQRDLWRQITRPNETGDPAWKWRRAKK
jgi:type II secretory pathway component GspD/PulD (secretin)